MSAQIPEKKKHLAREAYQSLLNHAKRCDTDIEYDWDAQPKDRRHAMNAALDLRDAYECIAALTERAEQAKELTRSVKRTYDLNLRTFKENYEIQMREDTQEILDANDRIITLTVERDTWRSLAERAEAQVAAYEKPVSLDEMREYGEISSVELEDGDYEEITILTPEAFDTLIASRKLSTKE